MLCVPCRSVDYSGLPPVLNNWTTSGPGVNASSSTLMDVWEVPLYTEQWFTTRTRAFFRAPVTGPHTFSIVADDYAQLTASWLQVGCLVLGRSGEGCCIQASIVCQGPGTHSLCPLQPHVPKGALGAFSHLCQQPFM